MTRTQDIVQLVNTNFCNSLPLIKDLRSNKHPVPEQTTTTLVVEKAVELRLRLLRLSHKNSFKLSQRKESSRTRQRKYQGRSTCWFVYLKRAKILIRIVQFGIKHSLQRSINSV